MVNFPSLIAGFWKPIGMGTGIFILCLFPAYELQKLDVLQIRFSDLLIHLMMFLVFSAVLYADLSKFFRKAENHRSPFAWALSICLFMAFTTEMLQYLLAFLNRNANLADLLFDCAGSVIGIVLVKLIKHKSGPGS